MTELLRDGGRVTGVAGEVLEPTAARRGTPSPRTVVGDFTLQASAVIVASGGIGANHELVRRFWPGGPQAAPDEMLSGVPDSTDGLMLGVAERAGGRIINRDRMWHYPEGVHHHTPEWTGHGIRILSGPSPLWLDAFGRRLPAPLFPGFDALGALRHIVATGRSHSWFVAGPGHRRSRVRAVRFGHEPGLHVQVSQAAAHHPGRRPDHPAGAGIPGQGWSTS